MNSQALELLHRFLDVYGCYCPLTFSSDAYEENIPWKDVLEAAEFLQLRTLWDGYHWQWCLPDFEAPEHWKRADESLEEA